ncbi:FERM domain-containing protein 8-like [Saccostrea cucullata]|uniref:FERM domain-containing protein 8-like n=1 Tax=Saccostrea cuccullata TaxID=36930 RepID=UPI002ED2056C
MAGRSGRYLQTMDKGDSADEETGIDDEHNKHNDPAGDTVEVVIWTRDMVGIHHITGYEATAENLFKIVVEEKQLPPESENIFSIWLVSPLLELRLKKNHIPFQFAQLWDEYCELYTDANPDEISRDEPVVMFQRNVFLTLEEEMKISDEVVLNLLYHEAKFNVIEGRYVLQAEEYDQLAGIQALIHLEHYNEKTHTLEHYKEELHKFYPAHMRKPKNTKFFNFGGNRNDEALEVRVQSMHQQISAEYKNTDIKEALGKLYRKYLEVCWQYAFYGSAFFEGRVQKPVGKIIGHLPGVDKDIDVLIALNTDGICIIDQLREEPMLAVPYEDLSWHLKTFKKEENRMPVLLLQLLVKNENGDTISKVLPVFSKQANMMDALIDSCVKRKLRLEKMVKKAAEKSAKDGARKDVVESAQDGARKDGEESALDGPRKYRNENFCCKISNKLDKMNLVKVP